MPPIRDKNSRNSIKQEGKTSLAISNLKSGKISSVRRATHVYDIPYMSLYERYRGIQMKAEKHVNRLELSTNEEESLVK
jgi:hypothetical protein